MKRIGARAGEYRDERQHAIVIGAGIMGLCAARVCADHFDHVTVVERDKLPDGVAFRPGVPQSRHIHEMLVKGKELVEELFPGLDHELERRGADAMELLEDTRYLLPTGWTPRFRSAMVTRGCTRELLEGAIRERVSADPKISFVAESTVEALVTDGTKERVVGIVGGHGSSQRRIDGNLVIDASGRESSAPDWLEAMGYQKPAETEVSSFLGYATRRYRRPRRPLAWKQIQVMPTPERPRGGAISPIEGGRWVVTLAGAARDYPPTTEGGFLAFAKSFADPTFHDALTLAEPESAIYGARRTTNRVRHFEKCQRWPEGFIVMGDAVCAFNPIYGQGMSVAAMSAMALGLALAAGKASFCRGFQRSLCREHRSAWLLATGDDRRYSETQGASPGLVDRLTQRYVDWLLSAMPRSPTATLQFLKVLNLTAGPLSLFDPRIVAAAALARGRAANIPELPLGPPVASTAAGSTPP
jgi:2-polyprenyl-6-methoxyphenol hydroxylase-like FAD-dependent oxidoreductase